jgi:hypothetical protein
MLEVPKPLGQAFTIVPLPTLKALTSLLQSWKMSLVRILQEASTIVCFMMLLWQVAGDTSSPAWEQGRKHREANCQPAKEGCKRPCSWPCYYLQVLPPATLQLHKNWG